MSILITGGNGFLGRHLKSALKIRPDVFAPSSQELNLLNFKQTRKFFQDNQFATVIHCAGFVGGVGLNVAEPSRMYFDNLGMGMSLIEALDGTNTHLVFISTICVYPGNAKPFTPEVEIFTGPPAQDTAAYGLAKRRILLALQNSNVKYTYLIPTNLYGPGDHFEDHKSHVVPALIKRVHAAKAAQKPHLDVWGHKDVIRDLLYVEDACTAILKASFSLPTNDVYNLSSGCPTTIGSLAATICTAAEYWGDIRFDEGKPQGAWLRWLDGRKFNETFDWAPQVPLIQGIQRTYRWYEESIAER